MTKRILVCADDYGQTLAISQAILSLITKKRLTAVSCMVTGNDWQQHADLLRPLIGEVDIGLHFNLTHLEPMSPLYRACYGDTFGTLSKVLLKSHLRLLKKRIIKAEFNAQWQRFCESLGITPHFIDGHQHVHQFPIIRNAVIDALMEKSLPLPFVRLVNPKGWGDIKHIIIKLSGTNALRNLLNHHNIKFNQSFTGIYSFTEAALYRQYMQRFLHDIEDQGLLMCHPGLHDPNEEQPLSFSRPLEYAYLKSDAFLDDLLEANVSLTRCKY